MRKGFKLKKGWLGRTLCVVLALGAGVCFTVFLRMRSSLPPQKAAERWRGENERSFAQVSCFFSDTETLTVEQIDAFRNDMRTKFHEAALDIDSDDVLMNDCWSTSGQLNVSTGLGKGTVAVTAVGGDFFSFHPLELVSGCYLHPDDLMTDKVMLDEDTAWLLFGSADVQGLSMKIEGQSFVVSGVIRRERDYASTAAWGDGMGIFMFYDAYAMAVGGAGITCYEVVMPQPVRDYAITAAREKIPVKSAEIVDNTGRFSFREMLRVPGQLPERLMKKSSVALPYWENAARFTELDAAAVLYLGILLLLFPLVYVTVCAVRLAKRGREKLSEDVIPRWKDDLGERIRIRQRKRWEKKHPGQV